MRTVAYLAIRPDLPDPVAGSDAAAAHWVPVDEVLSEQSRLAFDHGAVLGEGLERARAKLEDTPITSLFCPQPFTLTELRQVAITDAGRELRENADRIASRRATERFLGYMVSQRRAMTGERRPHQPA